MVPVLIFVYNRLEHTIQTIESLAKNINAQKTDVYIFSDGAKNQNSQEGVDKVRKYIKNIKHKEYFREVHIFESAFNNGLAGSIIKGVTQMINKHGKVIVLEDDLVTSINFIKYMNEALDYYESNEEIWSISGYNIPLEIDNNYNYDVYLSFRACSWGWATWKDRWELTDWEVKDYTEFSRDISLRRNFNRGGRDLSFMLDDQMAGKINSWAIRWCYSQFKLKKYTIYPSISFINNIGLDGSGTHHGYTSHYDTELNRNSSIKFVVPELNKEILNKFQNHYMSKNTYFKEYIKRKIKRVIGR